MNLNDLRMSLKAALDNMWARIDARITAIEQGGGGGGVIDVPHGGTGANTVAGAISALFDVSTTQSSVTSYPNAPGVYQVIGTNIFQHLSPASPYGTLIIIGRVYAAHFYIDSSSSLYVGHSGDTFGEPTTWRTCT